MSVFYANCRYENWDACVEHEIFGLRGKRLPNIEPGDLILLRVTGHSGDPYGVKAIWRLESTEKVGRDTFVPWKDGEYHWVLHSTPLATFKQPFSEEFATSSKVSQKIDSLYATRIMGSIGELKSIEALAYIDCIIAEKNDELEIPLPSDDSGRSVMNLLIEVRDNLSEEYGVRIKAPATSLIDGQEASLAVKPAFGIVGERIDLPILNYAPLNEQGVVLLFGYYLRDLGFSHLEEIRTGFPDAIGMQRLDSKKNRRVRIEFEYQSRNFMTHGHPIDECDVVVCWEHNWSDCPLEVIELRTALILD